MESEDDRPVRGEQRVKIVIREAVRVLARRLKLHEIDDIDDPYLEFRRVPSKEGDGGEGLKRWNVTGTSHHHIGLGTLIVAGPLPNAESSFAMLDRLVHRQPLRRGLLTRDDDVHVVSAAQTVIGNRQQ